MFEFHDPLTEKFKLAFCEGGNVFTRIREAEPFSLGDDIKLGVRASLVPPSVRILRKYTAYGQHGTNKPRYANC